MERNIGHDTGTGAPQPADAPLRLTRTADSQSAAPNLHRRLLTLKEAAAYLALSTWTVRDLVWKGRLLNRRLGDIAAGRPLNLRADRITVGELLDDLLTEYEVNERASLRRMKELVSHLRDALGHMRAAAVTTADVNRYIIARQAAKAANATINRELAALKRACSLAYKATKILAEPYIPMLAENNVRTGFFEPYQLQAVRAKLPPPSCGA